MRHFVAALVAASAFAAGHVHQARAAATCSSIYSYAGGGFPTPTIGSSYSVNVKFQMPGTILYNTGHVAGWAGVSFGQQKWIQAGLSFDYQDTLAFYIEINDGTGPRLVYWNDNAYWNVPVTVTITHVGNQVWEASVNGVSYTLSGLAQNSGIITDGEVWNTTSACNVMSIRFSASTDAVAGHLGADWPYAVGNLSTYAWTSYGPPL